MSKQKADPQGVRIGQLDQSAILAFAGLENPATDAWVEVQSSEGAEEGDACRTC
jgi:hypothetical protein